MKIQTAIAASFIAAAGASSCSSGSFVFDSLPGQVQWTSYAIPSSGVSMATTSTFTDTHRGYFNSLEANGAQLLEDVVWDTAVTPKRRNIRNTHYALRIKSSFDAGREGNWCFRYLPDFGYGGAMYVDGVNVAQVDRDLWWGNGDALRTTTQNDIEACVQLEAGEHSVEVYGAEGSAGGPNAFTFKVDDSSYVFFNPANLAELSGGLKVKLSEDPAGTVAIDLNDESFFLSPCSLGFDSSNWDEFQYISYKPRPTANGEAITDRQVTLRAAPRSTSCGFAGVVGTLEIPEVKSSASAPQLKQCISWGDPHFKTFDGDRYDFFGKGDFFLFRDQEAKFVVQTRQAACGNGRVTCNFGMALKYQDEVVLLELDHDAQGGRGQGGSTGQVSLTSPGNSGIFGITVSQDGNSYTFTTPTGDFIKIVKEFWSGANTWYWSIRDFRAAVPECTAATGLCFGNPRAGAPVHNVPAAENLFGFPATGNVLPLEAKVCEEPAAVVEGFGEICEQQLTDFCAGETCSDNGSCDAASGRCICDAGFTGVVCQIAADSAALCSDESTCVNGVCTVLEPEVACECTPVSVCECAEGWFGPRCDLEKPTPVDITPTPGCTDVDACDLPDYEEEEVLTLAPFDGDTALCTFSSCYDLCFDLLGEDAVVGAEAACLFEVRMEKSICDENPEAPCDLQATANNAMAALLSECTAKAEETTRGFDNSVCGTVSKDGQGEQGVTITLKDAIQGTTFGTTTTDEAGEYCFTAVPFGSYVAERSAISGIEEAETVVALSDVCEGAALTAPFEVVSTQSPTATPTKQPTTKQPTTKEPTNEPTTAEPTTPFPTAFPTRSPTPTSQCTTERDARVAEETSTRNICQETRVTITGSVRSYFGLLEGARLQVAAPGQFYAQDCRTDGTFTFSGLPRRNALVVVTAPGYYNEVLSVQLAVNTDVETIELPPIVLKEKGYKNTRMLFGGDIMLGRRYIDPNTEHPRCCFPNRDYTDVGALINALDPQLDSEEIFRFVQTYIDSADFTSANLNSAVVDEVGSPHDKEYVFFTLPESLRALKRVGINHVNIAHNNIFDYLSQGVADTVNFLRRAGLYYSGAGMNEDEAFAPWRGAVGRRGDRTTFSFMGMTTVTGKSLFDEELQYVATADKAGAADGTKSDVSAEKLATEVAKGNYPIVQLHAGTSYSQKVTDYVRTKATGLIEAGAQMVIGHHPNVAQGVGAINGKIHVHSLGNFADDSQRHETLLGLLARADVEDGADVHSLRMLPIYLKDMRPRPVVGQLADVFLRRTSQFSHGEGLFTFPYLNQLWSAASEEDVQTTERVVEFDVSVDGETIYDLREHIKTADHESLASVELDCDGVDMTLGRDIMMYGDMEDSDIDDEFNNGDSWRWDMRGGDSYISTLQQRRGQASMCLDSAGSEQTAVPFRNRIRVEGDAEDEPNKDLTIFGYIKGEDVVDARIVAEYFASKSFDWDPSLPICPYPINNLLRVGIAAPEYDPENFELASGTYEWQQFSHNLNMPADIEGIEDTRLNPRSVRVWLTNSGCSRVCYDEVALISWDAEHSGEYTEPKAVQTPHSRDFVRFRSTAPKTCKVKATFKSFAPKPDVAGVGETCQNDLDLYFDEVDEIDLTCDALVGDSEFSDNRGLICGNKLEDVVAYKQQNGDSTFAEGFADFQLRRATFTKSSLVGNVCTCRCQDLGYKGVEYELSAAPVAGLSVVAIVATAAALFGI